MRAFRFHTLLLLLLLTCAWAGPGAAARTIEFTTTEVTEADVTVSPDGQWLIFTMLGHLFRLPVTGGTAEQLTFGPYYDSDPVFSPDGKHVAFVSDRDGSESNIFLLELATGRVTQVTHEAWAARPAWSPDGRAIVYLSMVPAGSSLVPVVRHGIPATVPAFVRRTTLSSGDTETLTSEPRIISSVFHLGDGQLAWAGVELAIEQGSPRAVTRIEVWRLEGGVSTLRTVAGYAGPVYVSSRGDGFYCRRIFPVLPWYTQRVEDFIFVPLDDGAERLLFSLSRPRGWTPKFAVTADNNTVYLGESSRLWRVSIQTGFRTPVPFLARVRMEIEEPVQPVRQAFLPPGETVTVRAILDPKLSPDGPMLAFSAAGYVWLQRLDGTPAQRLTSETGFESEPVFSPDGQLIAFVHTRDGRQEIRAINLRSRGAVLRHSLPEEDTHEWQLAWTPAGDRVLFVEPAGSSYSVVTVSLGDGTKRKLTEVAWQVGSRPHLAADEKWLYYTGPPGAGTFHRLALDGSSKPEPLTQLSEQFSRALLSPDGKWLAFRRNMEIWIARVDKEHPVRDSDIRQLSSEGGKSFDFTRDGSAVIYAVGNRVWRQSLATSEREEIPIRLEVRKAVPPPLLLHRVRVLDFRGGFSRETSVFIEGGRIRWIGPESGRSVPEGTRILDAAGRFAIPGLFDMHSHIGYPVEQYLALPYGMTSLRNPGGLIAWSNAFADRGEISSDPVPRHFFSGEGFHGALLLRTSQGLLIHDESEAREYVRQRKRSGAHLLKVYWPLPWSLHRVVADEARRHGIPVVGHGSNGIEEIAKSVTLGYATLEHSLIPTRSGDDVLQLLAAAGTRWTPTVSTRGNGLLVSAEPERMQDSKLRALIPDVWVQRWLADRTLHVVGEHEARGRFAALLVSIKAAHERGVKLLIGTDRLPPSLHWELEYFVQAGISPLEVLRIATQQAAEAVGAQDDLGTLEPGKLADIVLLDKNPLEDIRNTQTIWRVIKGGWLFDPEKLRPPASIGPDK